MDLLSSVLCITLVFFPQMGCPFTNLSKEPIATAPGNIIVGGIFPIHQDVDKKNASFAPHRYSCIRYQETGLAHSLAMINAIEVMNKSPPLADINITLGYWIKDSCSDVSTALRVTAEFTKQGHCGTGASASSCSQPVMAIIGASSSELSITIARQLTLEMIPQISYSSSAVILSDKNRFPAFLRTVPNDEHQTAAMVSLLNIYRWNWVGILTTDGDYGRSALDNFVSHASEKGICVAFKSILPQSVTGQGVFSAISQAAETISLNPKVKVILSFVKPTHMAYLYTELKNKTLSMGLKMESMRRVWVASDSWSSSSSSIQGNVTLHDIGHIVGFTFKSGNLSSLNKYLDRLGKARPEDIRNNSFLQEFYMQFNGSAASGATEVASQAMKTLRQHVFADRALSIEMAVSAIAGAVASICRTRDCKTPGALHPWEVLEALRLQKYKLGDNSYMFDQKGDLNSGYDVTMWRSCDGTICINDVVAEYNPHSNSFTSTKSSTTKQFQDLWLVKSKCSRSCNPGEFKKTVEGQHTCCYECSNCTENYYSNHSDMDQCLSCNLDTEWSPERSSYCRPKMLTFFSWQDSFAIVLVTLSALGILLVFLVSILFLLRRDTPVVKAAGGPLSQVILFSLVVSFISAILFVGRPSSLQCKTQQVLFGISFTLCVSCILCKTLKILLAFQFNPDLQHVLRRLCHPCVIVTVCMALQTVTCICWLVLKSPYREIIRKQTTLLERCHEGSHLAFGVMLGYIALLAFVCFICAFKGRKLPQKYNDAKFITFSMLLYLISWVLFVPVYINASRLYRPAVEMVIILISNYGIFSCHFLPKCYIILFKKEENTQAAFRNNLYEYSTKTGLSASVSGSLETSNSQQDIVPSLSSSISAAYPLSAAGLNDNRNSTTFTVFHRGSHTRQNYRRRTSSI